MPECVKLNEAVQSHHIDPLDGRVCEFDWETLALDLGELDLNDTEATKLAVGIHRVIAWCCDNGRGKGHTTLERMGRRMLVLAWVINPAMLEDCPTLVALAKRFRLRRMTLTADAADLARVFNVRNRESVTRTGRPKG